MKFGDDQALFRTIREQLFSAVVGDVLDTLGQLHQFLPPELTPLHDDMVVVGRAMPVLEADFFLDPQHPGHNPLSGEPFGLMFRALDDLRPGEVYVASGSSMRYALWGELMSTRALKLGAAGAVLDGYTRDTRGILRLGFPTVSRGRYAQDQGVRGKVVDYRVPLEIGGVRISPGDLILGDLDGTLVIPRTAEREVLTLALEKVGKENLVRRAIEEGSSTVDAFERFGVM